MAADAEGGDEVKSAILAILLALPCVAQSVINRNQLTFPLSLSVGDFGEYGYESPYSDIGAGIEWRSRRVMLETSATFSPTAKLDAGDGYSLSGKGAFLIRPVRSFIVGGGFTATQIQNSKWSKSATRPYITAGLDTDRWRIAIAREIPGTTTTAQTGLTAGTTVVFMPAAGLQCHSSSATTITVTTTGTPGAGVIKFEPVYRQYTAPTS